MLEFLTQSPWTERIGWTLVHSLWQFALVALAAVVLQRALARRSAAARYRALLAAMAIMAAAPLATWFSPWSSDASATATEVGPGRTLEMITPLRGGDDPLARRLVPSSPSVDSATRSHASPFLSGRVPDILTSWWSSVKLHVHPWLPLVVLVWLAGVMAAAVRPLLSWYTVRQLKTEGISPVADVVQDVLKRAAERLRLFRTVRVVESAMVRAPVVLGCLRPVILLPMCLLTSLPAAQLESILAHELAHIRRHDYLANVLQTCVETLFFYHPAVWWLSRQIRDERENCCDDVAMAAVGSRVDYGRALLAIEESRGVRAALSVGSGGGSLVARIRRVAGCEPAQSLTASGSVLGLVLVSIAAVGAALWGATPAAEGIEGVLPSTNAEYAAPASPPPPTASLDPFAPPAVAREKAREPNAAPRTMRLRVVGPDGAPVAGADVMVSAEVKGQGLPRSLFNDYKCDSNGETAVELPKADLVVRLNLWKRGYLELIADWEDDRRPGGRPFPQDVTLKLAKLAPEQAQAVATIRSLGLPNATSIRTWITENEKGRRTILELAGDPITDRALDLLRRLPDLDELFIIAPNVTDAGLMHLGRLCGLKELVLASDKITDAGLAHLEGLRGLKGLRLMSPEITDAGLVHLQSLHALERLTLVCSVTDAGMKHLTPLKELKTLIGRRVEADSATRNVFHAIAQPTQIEFMETPLPVVLEHLGKHHGIRVDIDEAALRKRKINREVPISINVKNVPLAVTLDLLFPSKGLDWTVGKGALLITASETVPRETPGTAVLRQALPSLKQVSVDW